jgi:hypothetical protein
MNDDEEGLNHMQAANRCTSAIAVRAGIAHLKELLRRVLIGILVELSLAAFGAEINGLGSICACCRSFLGINGHLADRIDNRHSSSEARTVRQTRSRAHPGFGFSAGSVGKPG